MIFIIKNNMKFKLFFNKCLIDIERRYWFTKLKIIDLMWIVRRIRHMIEIFNKSSMIVYTNHFVIVSIIKQIKFINLFVDKLNLRLIRVSIYLSQFSLNVRHKSKIQHIVFHTLSRLFISASKFIINNLILNNVYFVESIKKHVFVTKNTKYSNHTINVILIQMSLKFKTLIIKKKYSS